MVKAFALANNFHGLSNHIHGHIYELSRGDFDFPLLALVEVDIRISLNEGSFPI